MSQCKQLADLLLGRLRGDERRALAEHAETCPRCRASAEVFKVLVEELRGEALAEPIPKPTEGRALALVALAARQQAAARAARMPMGKGIAAAALVLCSAVALYAFFQPDAQEAPLAALPTAARPRILALRGASAQQHGSDSSYRFEVLAPGKLVSTFGGDTVALGSSTLADLSSSAQGLEQVVVHRGEMAFDIAVRGPQKRLSIRVGRWSVSVIGTRFTVSMGPGSSVEVAVHEGSLRVSSSDGSARVVHAAERFIADEQGAVRVEAASAKSAARCLELLEPTPEPLPLLSGTTDSAAQNPIGAEEAKDSETAHRPSPQVPDAAPDTENRNSESALDAIRQLILSGNYRDAEQAILSRLESRPRDVDALDLLAGCRRKAGRIHGAIDAYRRLAESPSPRDANRARFLAASLLQDNLGAHADALPLLAAYLESTAATKPLAAEAFVRQARAQSELGQTEAAAASARKAIELFPGTPSALQARAILQQLGERAD